MKLSKDESQFFLIIRHSLVTDRGCACPGPNQLSEKGTGAIWNEHGTLHNCLRPSCTRLHTPIEDVPRAETPSDEIAAAVHGGFAVAVTNAPLFDHRTACGGIFASDDIRVARTSATHVSVAPASTAPNRRNSMVAMAKVQKIELHHPSRSSLRNACTQAPSGAQ